MQTRKAAFAVLVVMCFACVALAQKGRSEDQNDYYRKWLDETVRWLISEEEVDVFKELSSDDERDAFIEQFWRRRDPNPATAHNEFKEEHYRRLVYANEHFTAGLDGWASDRGMIYIRFGPPDRRETYPAGGQYQRERKEGGGYTSVFPFERWEYREIPGIGQDIVLEFVDDKGGGLYELTFDRQRKDELLHTGFAAPTWDEQERAERTGVHNKQDRIARRRISGDWRGAYAGMGGFETAADKPFAQLELSGKLNSAPEVKYKDLEAAVSSRITYDRLAFSLVTDFVRISPERALALITVQVPNKNLNFKGNGDGLQRAQIQIFGRVMDLGKRIVNLFEDDLAREYPQEKLESAILRSSVYQHHVVLRPGVYKLEVGIKDANSDNIGTATQRIQVTPASEESMSLSSLILASRIEPAPEDPSTSRFVLGDLKVIPRAHEELRASDTLGLYLQIYAPGIDQQTSEPDLKVEYALSQRGQPPTHWRDSSAMVRHLGGYCRVARMVNLSQLTPGHYELKVRVRDRISGHKLDTSAQFRVVE